MITLKDGTKTGDIRLDRIKYFDERSRGYPIRRMVARKKMRSYTWRCNVYLDQGSEGACVGFGITHELAARPSEVDGLTNKFAREAIYWEAQKIDEWKGEREKQGSNLHSSHNRWVILKDPLFVKEGDGPQYI